MIRTYNIGTECYALLTSVNEPEFLLPVKIVLLEKYTLNNRTTYKVKIRDIYETNFNFLKEHFGNMRFQMNLKSENRTTLIRKLELDKITGLNELLINLNDKAFYLEDNYITLDKDGLFDLYNRFVKYIINYHYTKLFQLMNRSFIANTPIFENQKEIFKKRVEKIGFGDIFEKYNFKLDI